MTLQHEKWGAAAISMVCFVALTSVGIGLVKSGPVSRYEEENPYEESDNLAAKQIGNRNEEKMQPSQWGSVTIMVTDEL